MIVIPAVDIKDGKCVRLSQGCMESVTVYSEDPVEMAIHWESKGAERLHIVDLDGAVLGRPVHRSVISEIISSVKIPVEVGGGIRDLNSMEDYLSLGARWVILGTAGLERPELVEDGCRHFRDRIILSVDARGDKVAIRGWKEVARLDVIDVIARFESVGLSALIYTDIERDGMNTGLNWESTKRLAMRTAIPLIASGGLSTIEEITRLKELETVGVIGVIIGRALYSGRIDLEEAIRLAMISASENSAERS